MASSPIVTLLLLIPFCSATRVQKLSLNPEVASKFNDLDKLKKSTNYNQPKAPEHIKSAVHFAKLDLGAIPLIKTGGCGKRVKASMLGLKPKELASFLAKSSKVKSAALEHPGRESFAIPGAGVDQTLKDEGRSTLGSIDGTEPYVTVMKDGYFEVGCFNDDMNVYGDKFGNGKFNYKQGSVSNTSIVHYAEIIPKEDREKITINRCFEFCRTVPNMVYFGLNNGNDCYCTPYYKPMAGDNSNCDLPCEGDPSQMCGGKMRTSVFEMHSCDDTRSDLEDIITKVEDTVFLHLQDLADHVKDIADEGLYDSTEMRKVWGRAGASDMSAFMQEAVVYSGEIEKPALEAQKLIDELQDAYDVASQSLNKNLRQSDNLKAAEEAIINEVCCLC